MPKQKGAHLLAPHNRHVDAYDRAVSARPLRGAPRTLTVVSKFPVSIWTAAEATRIGFGLLVYVTCVSPSAQRIRLSGIYRQALHGAGLFDGKDVYNLYRPFDGFVSVPQR